jgi:hypothetical protein
MNKDIKLEDIIAYFNRTMPEQQRQAFKAMLDADPLLKQKAVGIFHEASLEALEDMRLKAKMAQWQEKYPVQALPELSFWTKYRTILSVAASVLVLIVSVPAGYWVYQNSDESESPLATNRPAPNVPDNKGDQNIEHTSNRPDSGHQGTPIDETVFSVDKQANSTVTLQVEMITIAGEVEKARPKLKIKKLLDARKYKEAALKLKSQIRKERPSLLKEKMIKLQEFCIQLSETAIPLINTEPEKLFGNEIKQK